MTDRTYQIKAQGYSNDPNVACQITAKIDNVIVCQGPVDTLYQPLPQLPDLDNFTYGVPMFSWTKDIDWQGDFNLEISVQTGTLLFCDVICNYNAPYTEGLPPGPAPFTPWVYGPDNFYNLVCFHDISGVLIDDPIENVTYNDVPFARGTVPPGQWFYRINAGTVFKSTICAQFFVPSP